jgi:hypothetical protein
MNSRRKQHDEAASGRPGRAVFVIEEVAAEMIAGGYEFEPPPIPCPIRMRDVLERMTDAELALQPGEIAEQERKRRQNKQSSLDGSGIVCMAGDRRLPRDAPVLPVS